MTGPEPHPVPDPVAYLAGRWAIARTVRDAASGTEGTFTGIGTFAPDGAGLAYDERGELDLGHWRGASSRALYYAPDGPGRVAVRFADGRPFHDLDLRAGSWHAHHPCAPDAYDGAFTVVSADEWRQTWHVRGPRKDQVLASVYTRLPG